MTEINKDDKTLMAVLKTYHEVLTVLQTAMKDNHIPLVISTGGSLAALTDVLTSVLGADHRIVTTAVNLLEITLEYMDSIEILVRPSEAIGKFINDQRPVDPEFSDIVDSEFWGLLL